MSRAVRNAAGVDGVDGGSAAVGCARYKVAKNERPATSKLVDKDDAQELSEEGEDRVVGLPLECLGCREAELRINCADRS